MLECTASSVAAATQGFAAVAPRSVVRPRAALVGARKC